MTFDFILGVFVGMFLATALLLWWGWAYQQRKLRNARCPVCYGPRDVPTIVKGTACPSPFHAS